MFSTRQEIVVTAVDLLSNIAECMTSKRVLLLQSGVPWSVCRTVCRSVYRSDTIVSPSETAEPIKMPFGVWTRVGPRKRVRWGPDPRAKGRFLGEKVRPVVTFSFTKYDALPHNIEIVW